MSNYGGYGRGGSYQVRDGDDQYLERSQRITSNIFQINRNVTELGKYISHLGTNRDHDEMRNRMQRMQEQTRNIIRDTNLALKQLSQADLGTSREATERRMQKEKLSKDFKSVLQKFQSQSQVALSKERETIGRGRAPLQSRQGGGGYGGQNNYDDRTALIEQQQREQAEHLDNQIDYSSSIISDREESIKEIEATMLEVNDIYRDLSTLVVEQGNQLDNIEANMSSADSAVDHGTEQLGTASRYQKKSRNKLCCMLVILAVVAAVIVIIIVTQTAGKKK